MDKNIRLRLPRSHSYRPQTELVSSHLMSTQGCWLIVKVPLHMMWAERGAIIASLGMYGMMMVVVFFVFLSSRSLYMSLKGRKDGKRRTLISGQFFGLFFF